MHSCPKSDDLFRHHPLTCHTRVRLSVYTVPPIPQNSATPQKIDKKFFLCRPGGAPRQIQPHTRKLDGKNVALGVLPPVLPIGPWAIYFLKILIRLITVNDRRTRW